MWGLSFIPPIFRTLVWNTFGNLICIRIPSLIRYCSSFSFGEGNGNPLQYSCLENPGDRGAWGLLSIGSHRVGHDWSDLACMHALEKEIATHSCILAWKNLRDGGAWWAAVCGVAQSRTWLKQLSSSNSRPYHFLKTLKLVSFKQKLSFSKLFCVICTV